MATGLVLPWQRTPPTRATHVPQRTPRNVPVGGNHILPAKAVIAIPARRHSPLRSRHKCGQRRRQLSWQTAGQTVPYPLHVTRQVGPGPTITPADFWSDLSGSGGRPLPLDGLVTTCGQSFVTILGGRERGQSLGIACVGRSRRSGEKVGGPCPGCLKERCLGSTGSVRGAIAASATSAAMPMSAPGIGSGLADLTGCEDEAG